MTTPHVSKLSLHLLFSVEGKSIAFSLDHVHCFTMKGSHINLVAEFLNALGLMFAWLKPLTFLYIAEKTAVGMNVNFWSLSWVEISLEPIPKQFGVNSSTPKIWVFGKIK